MKKFLLRSQILILLFVSFVFSHVVMVDAQDDQTEEPVYIVEPGDTLWAISRTFNVSIDDLSKKNGIDDPSQLSVGARLTIPGYEGLQGVLVIKTVPFGETINSLSKRYKISAANLNRLNRWTTPDFVAAGSSLITLDRGEDSNINLGKRATLRNGMSILELAVIHNTNRWMLEGDTQLQGVRSAFPGNVYYVPGEQDFGPGALPEVIKAVELDPPTAIQGKTFEIRIHASENLSLDGYLGDQTINFFPLNDGFVALQGIHAMLDPGYYPASLSGTLIDGTRFEFSQPIYIADGGYPYDPPLVVNSETIDVENTQPEDLEWFTIVEPTSQNKMWSGVFGAPVPEALKECYPSLFGSRRSYNGSAYTYFHTGLDFCGRTGVEIYAPAAGKVVFADSLVVRGNATVIDHGWGVYTAYAHQSEIMVSVGELVEKGQVIGLIGSTGRVTGPHLHWEVIVGGVQVDPLDWLSIEYP